MESRTSSRPLPLPHLPYQPRLVMRVQCVRMGGGCKPHIGLREAFREQSMFDGQGMRQCPCRVGANAKQCNTQKL